MPRGSAEARGNRVKNPIDENFITLPCALPLWAEFRDAALSHGLRACWSSPLVSTTGSAVPENTISR